MVRGRARRVPEVSLLLDLAGVRCPRDAEGVASLGKLNGSVLGRRRVVLRQIVCTAGSRSKGGSLDSVERLLALLILLGHLVSAWARTIDFFGSQVILVTHTVAKARAELVRGRRWGILHLIVTRTERLQVFVLVGLSGCGESFLIGDLVGERDGATLAQLHHLVGLRVLLLLDEAADIELLRLASLRIRVVRLTGARHAQIPCGSSFACAETRKKLLFGENLPVLGGMVCGCVLDGIVGTGAREVEGHLVESVRPLTKAHRGTHASEESLRFLLAGDS